MKPKVIMHTQVSLDGCIKGFDDTGIYYLIANRFNADMVLFGSETVLQAPAPTEPETEKAFCKPKFQPDDQRAYWVIPDSRGRVRNMHIYRDSQYCRDIIFLVSESTPKSYLEYLEKRQYDYILAGKDHVDYASALKVLYDKFDCRIIRTDSGGILTNRLLEQGIIDEICLVVSPCLIGANFPRVFRDLSLKGRVDLELVNNEIVDDNYLFLTYKVKKGNTK
jgi:2,5-diamino-6-(ribosylamino)-4(3H)-pyrimidinone 5'-phosphate reductase